MPFTFSHPAAVLPLARFRRGPYALSALIIGSMTPDLEYFFWFRHTALVGHSIPGLFVFCLPAGILALWCFHSFVKYPANLLLPKPFRRRLATLSTLRPRIDSGQSKLLALCVGVGAATHIAWDSITNQRSGLFAQMPAFCQTVFQTGGIDLNICDILQHGSTIAGLAILTLAAWLWMRGRPVQNTDRSDLPDWLRRTVLLSLFGLSVLSAMYVGAPNWFGRGAGRKSPVAYDHIAVAAMAALMFGILLYAAIYNLAKKPSK